MSMDHQAQTITAPDSEKQQLDSKARVEKIPSKFRWSRLPEQLL